MKLHVFRDHPGDEDGHGARRSRGCRNLSSTSSPPTLTKNTACPSSCHPPAHPNTTVLFCTVVCCSLLYSAVLCCTVLYVVYCAVLGMGRVRDWGGGGNLGAQVVASATKPLEEVQLPQKRNGSANQPRGKGVCTKRRCAFLTAHHPSQVLMGVSRVPFLHLPFPSALLSGQV